MYKVFKFGEIEVAACANAALPYRFKQVFRKELFDFMGKDLKAEDFTSFAGEVLFIMHSAAKKADMNSLSFDDYIEFMESIGLGDLLDQAQDIVAFMYETTQSTSSPKVNPGPRTDQ